MKQNDFNCQETNLTALSALIGELVAKRWIRHHDGNAEIPCANPKTPIDRIEKKSTMRAIVQAKRVKPSCRIDPKRADVQRG